MKKYLLLIGFLWLLISGVSAQQLIQGTLKMGAAADSIEVWLKPTFTNSTQYLFQIGMPIAFPSSASPAPTALNVTLDPGFVTTFGSNYTVTVNPVATATGGAEKYFNIVLVRAGAGASIAQNWTGGTEFKVLTFAFSPSSAPASLVKLADYQDAGSDGLGNFYTQSGNNDYYITTNSVGNFYATPGQSTVGGTASAGYVQTISAIPSSGCSAPIPPVVSNIAATTADINWSAVSGVVGYEYAVTTNVTPPASGTSTTGTTYSAIGLTPGASYYVHLRSSCTGGNFSTWVTTPFATLNPTCTAPSIPVVSSITETGASISWGAVIGASGYEYAITGSSTPPASGTAINSTTYNATGLTGNTLYYIHLRTACGAGNFSTWVSASFTTSCPATTSPVITNIAATSATINWSAVGGVAGYEYAVTTSATPPASGTATNFTGSNIMGLTQGTTYYVHVRSSCSLGVFSVWASASFTTSYSPCTAPFTPIVTNISDGVNISWGAVSGVSGYEYAVTTDNTLPASGTATTGTTYRATGLSSLTQYYVYVRSNCGAGGFSSWVSKSFTTLCLPPPVITGSINGNSANVNWNKVNGAVSYEYGLSTYLDIPVSGTVTTDTSQQLVNLSPGVGYYFHVRTNCAAGGVSEWATYSFHMPGLDAYPNPVSKDLTINLYGESNGNGQVSLYDAAGKLVKIVSMTGNTVTIDVRGLAAGVYLIRYVGGEHRYTLKVLRE